MVVGTTSRSVPYALGFQEAADRVIDAKSPQESFDLVLFPALYLYRHAFELTVKQLIYEFELWDGGAMTVLRTHKLATLWPHVRRNLERMYPEGDPNELESMQSLVLELDAVDPDGESLRYDVDVHGFARDLPPELMRVDLVQVKAVCGELLGRFGSIADQLAEARRERAWHAEL